MRASRHATMAGRCRKGEDGSLKPAGDGQRVDGRADRLAEATATSAEVSSSLTWLAAPDVFEVAAVGPEAGEPCLVLGHGASGVLMADGGERGPDGGGDRAGVTADEHVRSLLEQGPDVIAVFLDRVLNVLPRLPSTSTESPTRTN